MWQSSNTICEFYYQISNVVISVVIANLVLSKYFYSCLQIRIKYDSITQGILSFSYAFDDLLYFRWIFIS